MGYRGWAVVGVLGVALSALPASALNVPFAFTNLSGNVAGTVTGELQGLTDNDTGPATAVIITSFPAGLNSVFGAAPINAVLWNQQFENSFTVHNGLVVAGSFYAAQTFNGNDVGGQLYINGSGGYNFLNLDGTDDLYVFAESGLAAAGLGGPAGNSAPTLSASGLALTVAILFSFGLRSLRRRRLPVEA